MICKELGWDYWTFQHQPPQFIHEIMEHMNVEAQVRKENSRSAKSSGGLEEAEFPSLADDAATADQSPGRRIRNTG